MEVLRARLNAGKSPGLYSFRDSQVFVVDLLLASGRELIPIEITSTRSPSSDQSKGVRHFTALTKDATQMSWAGVARSRSAKLSPRWRIQPGGRAIRPDLR